MFQAEGTIFVEGNSECSRIKFKKKFTDAKILLIGANRRQVQQIGLVEER